jgi:hypothetical protein
MTVHMKVQVYTAAYTLPRNILRTPIKAYELVSIYVFMVRADT